MVRRDRRFIFMGICVSRVPRSYLFLSEATTTFFVLFYYSHYYYRYYYMYLRMKLPGPNHLRRHRRHCGTPISIARCCCLGPTTLRHCVPSYFKIILELFFLFFVRYNFSLFYNNRFTCNATTGPSDFGPLTSRLPPTNVIRIIECTRLLQH